MQACIGTTTVTLSFLGLGIWPLTEQCHVHNVASMALVMNLWETPREDVLPIHVFCALARVDLGATFSVGANPL